MFNFGRRIIRVTFVDDASGAIISSSRMPLERLPEQFGVHTELKMAGEAYIVLKAEPPTKSDFARTNQLKVLLRKRVL